jgi:hypothetical protein
MGRDQNIPAADQEKAKTQFLDLLNRWTNDDTSAVKWENIKQNLFQFMPVMQRGSLATSSVRTPPQAIISTHCSLCGKSDIKLQQCSGCKRVVYCSKVCQRSDWKKHKGSCQASQ